MEAIYLIWGFLLIAFVVFVLLMRSRVERATRRREGAQDPMFRRASSFGFRVKQASVGRRMTAREPPKGAQAMKTGRGRH